jgi:hypothetical protein
MIDDMVQWIKRHYFSKVDLVNGILDLRYFTEDEHINTSAGAGSAGKPIVLDAGGHIDATMINDADVDHGSTGGLADDDHSQYALLAGRSGGQTLKGGTASGDDLTLMSTNHATKGNIFFGASTYDEVNNRLGVGALSPGYPLVVAGVTSDTNPVLNLKGYTTGIDGARTAVIRYTNSTDANWANARHDAYDHSFYCNGSLVFSANATGGIGEAWTAVTYNTGWVDFDAAWTGAQYKKVGDLVFVRGMVKRTSGVATVMFTLPAGYRPTKNIMFAQLSNSAVARVDIYPDGTVNMLVGSATDWVNLNGIVFSTLS